MNTQKQEQPRYVHRIKDNLVEEVKVLHDRLKYLNELRLKAAQFYVVMVGAFFGAPAVLTTVDPIALWRYAGAPILIAGVAVLALDARLRGRADAATEGIRKPTELADIDHPAKGCIKKYAATLTDEDFLFGLIISIINASVAIIFFASLFLVSNISEMKNPCRVMVGLLMAALLVLLLIQMIFWKIRNGKWNEMDEWFEAKCPRWSSLRSPSLNFWRWTKAWFQASRKKSFCPRFQL